MTTVIIPEVGAIWQADTQQQVYRRVLRAFAEPGRIERLEDLCAPDPAWLAVLAALLDPASSLADPQGMLSAQHCAWLGAVARPLDEAAWILLDGRQSPPEGCEPCLGSIIAPERGATLVLRVDALAVAGGALQLELQGPGIAESCALSVAGLDPAWIAARNRWCRDEPLGLELVLASAEAIVAWPRTTRVEEAG